MNKISAVIIAFNEESAIGRCIRSLQGLVNEVILVDSGSTDGTVSIANGLGARVIKTDWMGYGAGKNLGNKSATGNWILSIDADEWVDDELKRWMLSVSLMPGSVYWLRRVNYIGGGAVYHGPYRPEAKFRLFQKGAAFWDDRLVHEKLVFDSSLSKVKMGGKLGHCLAHSFDELRIREDSHARLSAHEWHRKGRLPGMLKRRFGPVYHFVRAYVAQGGFLLGRTGWTMSAMQAFKHRQKIMWYKTLETRENPDKPDV